MIEKREKKAVALETYIALSCSCVGIWWVEGMLRNDCFIFYVCLNENKLLSIDVFLTKARIMFQNHLFFIVQQKRTFSFSFWYSLTAENIYENQLSRKLYILNKKRRFIDFSVTISSIIKHFMIYREINHKIDKVDDNSKFI